MYVLVLIITLAGNTTSNEVIGAFSHLEQCEGASLANSSRTKCYYLDPQKGMQEVNSLNTVKPSKKETSIQQ